MHRDKFRLWVCFLETIDLKTRRMRVASPGWLRKVRLVGSKAIQSTIRGVACSAMHSNGHRSPPRSSKHVVRRASWRPCGSGL